tara:strand:+ start:12261 stop:12893 length:633 start_codon:yes stop_codon:yes gene_type:complete
MPVDSKLLGNTNNAFQLTGNKHVLHKGCDAQNGAQNGGGYGATFKSLQANAENGLGFGNGSYENYNVCNKQSGGSAQLNELNNAAASSYGYTNSGGRKPKRKSRKRKPKRKSRKRKPKRKSRKRKPKRKSRKRKPKRKSRKRKPKRKSRKRRKSRKTMQKGGSSISYSSIDSSLTGNNARILGTNSFLASDKNCGDGYNHYTGGNQKTMY